jgi:hypothetical protein
MAAGFAIGRPSSLFDEWDVVERGPIRTDDFGLARVRQWQLVEGIHRVRVL